MQDLRQQRERMIDEDLRRRNIRDPDVLAAMAAIPRERFVPAEYEVEAYADRALPIGRRQTISQPYIVALVAQSLRLTRHETVLEVGSGSGYLAAVLSQLANWVVGVELLPELAAQARTLLREMGIDHVDIQVGDGRRGWPPDAPFDAIVVSAAAPEVPVALQEQLSPGGRLVMPIGREHETQRLTLVRMREGRPQPEILCPCRFVPLLDDAAGRSASGEAAPGATDGERR